MLLLGVLVLSIAGLVPGQSAPALGVEVLVIGLAMALAAARLPVTYSEDTGREPTAWKVSRHTVRAASIVPIVVAGLSLIFESGGGLYWLAAGVVISIAGAVASAWVLMVEILR